jgi:F0F1-type ATP synthase membrane subunit c/vacuolar-type H+-ATPase subunit K
MKTKLTKMIMSSVAFACASLCLAAAMAQGTFATARSEADARNCHVGMLRGLYLATLDGSQSVGGNLVPKAIMEGKRFNGDGTFSNDFGTVNIGGTTIINTAGAGGTYTVAADCTGTLSVPNGPTLNLYVGPGGQKYWFTQTAGGLGTGTATREP